MRKSVALFTTFLFFLAFAHCALADEANAPVITLVAPANAATSYYDNITFKYKPVDDTGFISCTLFANNSVSNIIIGESSPGNNTDNLFYRNITNGTWTWYVKCEDNATPTHNIGYSSNWSVIIDLDITKPVISLNSANITSNSAGNVNFSYLPVDVHTGIEFCLLYIGGELMENDSTISNNNTNQFSKTLTSGYYTWYVNCSDRRGNYAVSSQSLVDVITSSSKPIVALNSPISGAIIPSRQITFNYTPASPNKLISCALLINGSVNQSDNNIINNSYNAFKYVSIADGYWNWTVNCTDSEGYHGWADNRMMTVNTIALASTFLDIKLTSPADNSRSTSRANDFEYEVYTSAASVDYCELITNGSTRETDKSITKDTDNKFDDVELSNGVWEWWVRCSDITAHNYTSASRELTIDAVTVSENPPESVVVQNTSNNTTNTTTMPPGLELNPVFLIAIFSAVGVLGFFSVILLNENARKKFHKSMDIFRFNKEHKIPKEAGSEKHTRLKNYVKTYMAQGHHPEKIRQHLIKYGWDEVSIKDVYDDLESEKSGRRN
ncbi:MAG: hypothetical protein ABIG20_03000 [archaeon]